MEMEINNKYRLKNLRDNTVLSLLYCAESYQKKKEGKYMHRKKWRLKKSVNRENDE